VARWPGLFPTGEIQWQQACLDKGAFSRAGFTLKENKRMPLTLIRKGSNFTFPADKMLGLIRREDKSLRTQ
jgi:hypothetical protein